MTHYSESGLITLQGSALLSGADMGFLRQHSAELRDNWEKKQIFRTATEMEISVLNDLHFPTLAAKYWQCVREMDVMFGELVRLGLEYRRTLNAIARIERDLSDDRLGDFDRIDLQIDLDEKRFIALQQAQVAADRVRELREWTRLKSHLDDGSFDTADPGVHQLESYRQRFQRQAGSLQFASMPEAHNLIGQLQTAERVAQDRACSDSSR